MNTPYFIDWSAVTTSTATTTSFPTISISPGIWWVATSAGSSVLTWDLDVGQVEGTTATVNATDFNYAFKIA